MKNIHIITASAGSGKTYRLTELLEEKIASGQARPEAVMATTFTRKAAAEIEERVRQRLITKGLSNQANRLSVARLGTINSICSRIVSDFAFENGLFPEAQVLDEVASERELRRSISLVVTQSQTSRLAELDYLLNGLDWTAAVNDIITLARYNGLNQDSLYNSKEKSIQGLKELLGKAMSEYHNLEQELEKALTYFTENVDTEKDTTKKTNNALSMAQSSLGHLRQGRKISWHNWLKLSGLEPAQKSGHLAEKINQVAAMHDSHPRFHQDLLDAVSLVFDISINALKAYQEHKRLWGVLDFADQETLTLELLNKAYVKERLQKDIDLLLVDEFQDTSPLQLAILLKLAEISKETVWVGDQKQSIYGFRGTDPALMDACLDELFRLKSENKLETLSKSWRSRPTLVYVTSEVFSKAFMHQGIPEKQVRLTPADNQDFTELGPVVEWWTLNCKNQSQDGLALAQGVHNLIKDKSLQVRDKKNNKPRQIRAEDIAVLCRTNKVCSYVASALESLNIRAIIPKSGLLKTPEIMAVMAGMRLWVDSRDSLAAAELARLFHYPQNPGSWLETLLKNPGQAAFADLPELANIIKLSRESHAAGVQECLSMICRALNIRKWCMSWGNPNERLANLDSLQAHTLNYIQTCFQEGCGCTPAGLIAYLNDLHESEEDTCNSNANNDAVTVCTWHGAKGLEWPVTILNQIGKTFDPNALGVQVMHDWQSFSTNAPLADRSLRYWISPYFQNTKKSPFHERLKSHPSMTEITKQHNRQELRLLYVGWTRARDRLILAGRENEFQNGILSMLKDKQENWLLSPPTVGQATWAGQTISAKKCDLEPAEPEKRKVISGKDYPEQSPKEHPPARISPSDMSGQGQILHIEQIGERLPLNSNPNINVMGEAIHTFYAADRPQFDSQYRHKLAADILNRWEVAKFLDVKHLVQSADNLQKWVEHNFPKANWKREYPIIQQLDNGTQVNGFIDLLLETQDKLVIIDHKAFPGGIKEVRKKSEEYIGQLAAYEGCLKKIKDKEVDCFLFYPIAGCLTKIKKN